MNKGAHIHRLTAGYVLDIMENIAETSKSREDYVRYDRFAFSTLDELIVALKSEFESQKEAKAAAQREESREKEISDIYREYSVDDDFIFKTVEPFESSEQNTHRRFDKFEVEQRKDSDEIRIYNQQYKINIYTTNKEILRLTAMEPEQLKKSLSAYGQTSYANKAIVLRRYIEQFAAMSSSQQ